MKKNIAILILLFSNLLLHAQVSKTVNVAAGELAAALTGAEKKTVANLTVSGTIDARDFKTMRDSMPMLANINLGATDVLAYTGINGTSGENSYAYYVNMIPNYAFRFRDDNFTLQTIVLPSKTEKIGISSFCNCKGIKSIVIPSTVTSILSYAFQSCCISDALFVPSEIIWIGDGAFNSFNGFLIVDENNPNYSSGEGVLFNKSQTLLIQCPTSKRGIYTIPSTVTSLMDYSFSNCSDLNSIIFPLSLTSIGDDVFTCCSGLTDLILPPNLSSIGSNTFLCCYGLRSIIIPSSVKSIGGLAFQNCTSLDSVNISPFVTSIGDYAFIRSGAVIMVHENNSNYSSIDGALFNKLQTELIYYPTEKEGGFIVPSSVKKIVSSAFSYCANLTSIFIPSSVASIGNNVFEYCRGLTSFCVNSKFPIPLGYSAFYDGTKTICPLYIPFGSKSLYQIADQWKDFTQIIEMPGFSLSDSSITVPYGGDNDSVVINSNTTWTVSSDQSWFTMDSVTGTGDGTIIFKAGANPSLEPRVATVTISVDGVESQTIKVLQEASVATLAILEKNVIIGPDEGNTASATITSNTNWTTISDQQWLTISSNVGKGNDTLTFTAKANPSILPRIARVTVSVEGLVPQTITVTQEAVYTPATLLVSPDFVVISAEEGSTASALIAAKLPWRATSCDTWFTIAPENGEGNDTLVFTAKANLSSFDRPATVEITTTDAFVQTISVIQLAKFGLSSGEIQKGSISLFPNPMTDGFRLNGLKGKTQISIFDLEGRLLHSKEIEGNEYISATSLVAGVYIVRIADAGGQIEIRMIKE